MSRSNTLLLILGILLGFGGGLAYSWLISPVEYTDTAPASLRQDFKEDHLSLISLAYAATGDLNRTRARLALLGISASPEEISRLAQSRLAAGRPESEADALAQLAAVLGQRPAPLSGTVTPTSTGLSLAPSATATIAPSPTTRPSPTASPTPGAPFVFVEQEPICDPRLSDPLIQVLVQDAAGEGVAGIGFSRGSNLNLALATQISPCRPILRTASSLSMVKAQSPV